MIRKRLAQLEQQAKNLTFNKSPAYREAEKILDSMPLRKRREMIRLLGRSPEVLDLRKSSLAAWEAVYKYLPDQCKKIIQDRVLEIPGQQREVDAFDSLTQIPDMIALLPESEQSAAWIIADAAYQNCLKQISSL